MSVNPQVSKYMGDLARESWKRTRSKTQDMAEIGKKGAEARWKNHVKKPRIRAKKAK